MSWEQPPKTHAHVGLTAQLISSACPEQYNVFSPLGEVVNGNKIGYLRLRHGYFTCERNVLDKILYSATPIGDGQFDNQEERDLHLNRALEALRQDLMNEDTKKQGGSV